MLFLPPPLKSFPFFPSLCSLVVAIPDPLSLSPSCLLDHLSSYSLSGQQGIAVSSRFPFFSARKSSVPFSPLPPLFLGNQQITPPPPLSFPLHFFSFSPLLSHSQTVTPRVRRCPPLPFCSQAFFVPPLFFFFSHQTKGEARAQGGAFSFFFSFGGFPLFSFSSPFPPSLSDEPIRKRGGR